MEKIVQKCETRSKLNFVEKKKLRVARNKEIKAKVLAPNKTITKTIPNGKW